MKFVSSELNLIRAFFLEYNQITPAKIMKSPSKMYIGFLFSKIDAETKSMEIKIRVQDSIISKFKKIFFKF